MCTKNIPELVVVVETAREATDSGGGEFEEPVMIIMHMSMVAQRS